MHQGSQDGISDDEAVPPGTDEEYLHALRRKFVSALALLDERAFDRGVKRIEEAICCGGLGDDPWRVTVVWGTKA